MRHLTLDPVSRGHVYWTIRRARPRTASLRPVPPPVVAGCVACGFALYVLGTEFRVLARGHWETHLSQVDPELYALRPWYHDFSSLGFDTAFLGVPFTLEERVRLAYEVTRLLP